MSFNSRWILHLSIFYVLQFFASFFLFTYPILTYIIYLFILGFWYSLHSRLSKLKRHGYVLIYPDVSVPHVIYPNFFTWRRPAYLYRFSRDIPILALNHDFPISCGGVPILEDAGIFRAFRFRFVLFSPVFPNPPRILHLPPVKALRCRYK